LNSYQKVLPREEVTVGEMQLVRHVICNFY